MKKEKPRIVVLCDTSRSYGRGLLRGIAKYCRVHGLWDTHFQQALHMSKDLKLSERWGADAIIADIPYARDFEKLLLLNIPIVTTMAPKQKYDKLCYIDSDTFRTGAIAAEYYLEKGFKSYAFCGYKGMVWSKKRGDGFRETLEANGFTVSIYEQCRSRVLRNGENELASIAKWLKDLIQPVAIFTCNDERACHVIEACRLARLEVPDDVAIMGVDNDEIACDLFSPPLSSIALNTELAGYEAAELLEKLIARQKIDSNVILVQPKYVVERQSTDILQVKDENVAKAIRYIRQHSDHLFQVSDVLERVSISRRSLELKFIETLGHTIYDEIRKCHSKYIARMLIETNMPVFEITCSMGYTSEKNISRFFQKTTGYTPKQYRNKFGHK